MAQKNWFGLLGFNASATARVISTRWNDDEISFMVEETGVPGENHRPTQKKLCLFQMLIVPYATLQDIDIRVTTEQGIWKFPGGSLAPA